MGDNRAETGPKRVQVLAVHGDHLEAVARKRLLEVVALEVLGGVAGDGDVIVVNDELDVQALRNSQTGGLGVVALLLCRGRGTT